MSEPGDVIQMADDIFRNLTLLSLLNNTQYDILYTAKIQSVVQRNTKWFIMKCVNYYWLAFK